MVKEKKLREGSERESFSGVPERRAQGRPI